MTSPLVEKRLKYLADLNREMLPEDTNPDQGFRYIDIGAVGRGCQSRAMKARNAGERGVSRGCLPSPSAVVGSLAGAGESASMHPWWHSREVSARHVG